MMKILFPRVAGLCLCVFLAPAAVFAWDYEGHRLVNQLALASLPTNFPNFVFTVDATERVAFLSGEPDRWRNTFDLPLKHFNSPDHFIDLDDLPLYHLSPATVSHFRYEFTAQLVLAHAARPRSFPAIAATNDLDHTKALVGFLPWAITEYYAKLKSAFSYLKAFEEAGTPEEIANAQQDVIFYMGVLGHFVGDAAQPLHTTHHFNGWVGANPHGYTTNKNFHSWIDGGYFRSTGLFKEAELQRLVRPAHSLWPNDSRRRHDDIFAEVMNYIDEQHRQVEPLYRLEKEGKLTGEGERGLEGRNFLAGQLAKGAQMLGNLWYSAWQQAPEDTYLRTQLLRRNNENGRAVLHSSRNAPKSKF